MFDRRFLLELTALIVAGALCAGVANAVAARERRLAWVGDYPNARVVPQPITGTDAAALTPATIAVDPAQPEPVPEPAPETPTATAPATPARTQATPPRPRFTLADFPATPDTPSVNITPAQVEALFALKVPFFDARRTEAYRQGHIAGARSMPVWESDIDDRVMQFYEEGYPQEQPIVVYCSGGACEDSHMLAQKLWGIGYNNVLVYVEGWPDWSGRGLPVSRGDRP